MAVDCRLCRTTTDETLEEHLARRHADEALVMDDDPKLGHATVWRRAPGWMAGRG